MSILYMEGFEDVNGDDDLTARGVTFSLSSGGSHGTRPARYPDGTALVRGTNASASVVGFQRNLPRSLGNALFFSYQFYRTSFNEFPMLYPSFGNGIYLGSAAASNAITTSDDGINWVRRAVSPTPSTQNLCPVWDPSRNQYWAAVRGSNTTVQTQLNFLYSADLVTWTALPAITGTYNNIFPVMTFDETTNRLWCSTQSHVYVLEPDSSTWTSTFTPAAANGTVSTFAIDQSTGDRWMRNAALIYRGTAADTSWTPSDTLPAQPYSVAYGNGIVVASTTGAVTLASTDKGVTFTSSGVIPGYSGAASSTVVFFKGAFYLTTPNVNDGVYRSVNGLSWTRISTLVIPSAVPSKVVFTAGDFLYVYSGQYGIFYSQDGVTWNVREDGSTVGSTATIVNGIASEIDANVRIGLVINSDDRPYALLSQVGPTSALASENPVSRNTWHMLEGSMVKTGVGQYQYDLALDGMPLYSQSITFPDFTVRSVSSAIGAYPIATNGQTTICFAGSTLYYMTSLTGGMLVATMSASGSLANGIWTGKQFLVSQGAFIVASYDGITYRTVFSPGVATACMDSNGNTVIVTANAASDGRYWRSTDGGETWSEGATPLFPGNIVGAVFYEKGIWFAAPLSNSQPWQYSTDDGLTWQSHPTRSEAVVYAVTSRNTARAFGSVFFNVLDPSDSTIRMGRITVNSATDVELTYTNPNVPAAGTRWIGFNGRRLLMHAGSTNPVWYSEDGDTWTSVASLTVGNNNIGFLPIQGVFLFGGNTASNTARAITPELFDNPLVFRFDNYSFSRYDDIIVNDDQAPFAGPLGEGRLLKVPLDTAVQSEWNPNPPSLTNVEAATQQTVSTATAYVESNEAGQKDIYGTSAFSVPPGYRAAAVQVDGYYSRTLNSIPSARLGVRSGTSEDTTPVIPLTPTIGQKVYVSKIVQTNPATGGAWTAQSITDAQVTNERVE